MDQDMKSSVMFGLELSLLVFLICAIILIFPVSHINRQHDCTEVLDISAALEGGFSAQERQQFQDCLDSKELLLFGYHNYFSQLGGVAVLCAIFCVPLLFIRKLVQKKKYLIFIIPLVYLILEFIFIMFRIYLVDSAGAALLLFIVGYSFLYILIYLPLICLVVSLIASIYFCAVKHAR